VFANDNARAAYVATDALLDPGSCYKINRTLAIDKIKRQIGRWLLAATAMTRCLRPMLEEIALNLQKFVPDRFQPRKTQPKRVEKFYSRIKKFPSPRKPWPRAID